MTNTNTYYIRKAILGVDTDGSVLEEHYATTVVDGTEWCVDDKGDLESPIGNVSEDTDEVVLSGLTLEDMKSFMSSNKYNWR